MNATDRSIIDRKFSLAELMDFGEIFGMPGIANQIKRMTASNYGQFVSILNDDIDDIIGRIQENPELREDDGEDRLTIDIVNMLKTLGYDADHERKIGGHTDISVRGKNHFLWIGEAKIHGAYEYLYSGFQQLCSRYSTGDHNQDCGGLIIYIRNKNAANVVKEWRERFQGSGLDELEISDCPKKPDLVFHSSHKHDRSGRNFRVRHIGVILNFAPRDSDPNDKLSKKRARKPTKRKAADKSRSS